MRIGRDGRTVLRAAEDVGDEGMVIEPPYPVRAGWFQGIGFDKLADEFEVGLDDAEDDATAFSQWVSGGREEVEFPEAAEEGEEAEFVP